MGITWNTKLKSRFTVTVCTNKLNPSNKRFKVFFNHYDGRNNEQYLLRAGIGMFSYIVDHNLNVYELFFVFFENASTNALRYFNI